MVYNLKHTRILEELKENSEVQTEVIFHNFNSLMLWVF